MFYVFGGFRGFFLFLFLFFLFGLLRRWTHDGWAGGRLGGKKGTDEEASLIFEASFFFT